MSRMLIAVTLLLCINILLYLGDFKVLEGDLVELLFRVDPLDNNPIGFSQELNDTLPRSILISGQSEGGGEADPSDFRISDVPKTIFSLFKFLFNVMFAPIALFTSPALNLPVQLKFLLALPLAFIYMFLIINWWRGND